MISTSNPLRVSNRPLDQQRSAGNAIFSTAARIAVARLVLIAAVFIHSASGSAEDWNHWRGPNRNDVSSEASGWNGKDWIGSELWSTNVGEGSSSPIVVGKAVYLTGWKNGQDTLFCFDAPSGKLNWKQSSKSPRYGRHAIGDQSLYSGACSTPEYDSKTDYLFTLGTDGDLIAWNTARNGQRIWSINLYEKYKAPRRPEVAKRRKTRRDYGYTSSPLVIGDQVIVEVGGNKGNLVAFNTRTGDEMWTSENRDEAGHTAGPVPITVEEIPCVAVLTLRNLVVTRLDPANAGKTIAIHPWTTDYGNNIAMAAVHDDSIVITSSYNQAAICRLKISLAGAEVVWKTEGIASGVCTPVIHHDRVYWAWRGVHCVDFKSGKEIWHGGKIASQGSTILTSDNKLIVYGNKGDLLLVESDKTSPNKFKQLARQRIFSRTDAWPHVVLANGRIFCRDRSGEVKCFSTPGSE